MKVVLATPNFHQPRGNTVTVKRISDSLQKKGVETEIVSMTEDSSITSLPRADIVHGFNAYKFYKFKEKLVHKIDPYILSITGTDLNHDLFDQNKRSDMIKSLTEAKAIHVFDDEAKQVLVNEVNGIQDKIITIAQGTSDFPVMDLHLRKDKDTFLFLLPAGIRKVKNIPFAINMLKKLHDKIPNIRLWIIGPIIEEDEGDLVNELVKQNKEWISYLGQYPHSSMGSIYRECDAVLNTSHSEGQSAAILEAMENGLPVLVSNNQGNINLVSHEENGLVYNDQSQFLDFAERLVNNNELRAKLGERAKAYISRNHSGKYEVEAFLKIYKNVLNLA
ncbi:glycosyltransferase family 4 protein [Litchfieldia salsa]|uniref:Glycosyltransferase involved in cell wall bisynthesis n=1 Tax=Litchfieldia salsa TaxID=930152 RepID=A0A1H0WAT2_9BACI|nr:glycosyltransferase family 4 protein [Litchfieldia salsa]SDP87426.1 Glycosyltransferase involved in cell wall bisynthesis [Litchfieldia salsa]